MVFDRTAIGVMDGRALAGPSISRVTGSRISSGPRLFVVSLRCVILWPLWKTTFREIVRLGALNIVARVAGVVLDVVSCWGSSGSSRLAGFRAPHVRKPRLTHVFCLLVVGRLCAVIRLLFILPAIVGDLVLDPFAFAFRCLRTFSVVPLRDPIDSLPRLSQYNLT